MSRRRSLPAVVALTTALLLPLLGAAVPATADAPVQVGFGVRAITPVGEPPAEWAQYFTPHPTTGVWGEPYVDLDEDGCYSGATNEDAAPLLDGEAPSGALPEPFVDQPWNSAGDGVLVPGPFSVRGVDIYGDPDSTGKWDGVWGNAGFGAICALGAHDDTLASAVVLDDGETTVAMVSLDVVGLFNIEVQRMRAELVARYPEMAIDELVVSSTHTHEGVDTMGYWGQLFLNTDGKFPAYQAFLRSQVLDAVHEAWQARTAATVRWAAGEQPMGIRDSRPPFVVDGEVLTGQFLDAASGEVIGTVVNWSNHPEAQGSGNPYISSDFPHYTREHIAEATGAPAIFFTGSVGGLQTPLGVDITGPDGTRYGSAVSWERTEAVGDLVAISALEALEDAEVEPLAAIDAERRVFTLDADNNVLRALNLRGVFDLPTYVGADSWGPPEDRVEGTYAESSGPQNQTEMVRVTIGDAVFLTVPGELSPEIELGGYGRVDQTFPHWNGGEGSYAGCPEADTGRPHEPVLRETYADAEHLFVLGLGQDELGYIIPGYDFHLIEAPGDPIADAGYPGIGPELVPLGGLEYTSCGEGHYEETVSISSTFAPWVACVAVELAGTQPWGDEAYPACSRENTSTAPYGVRTEDLTDPTARARLAHAIRASHGHAHLPTEHVVSPDAVDRAAPSPEPAAHAHDGEVHTHH
jgi:hypothetical protein